MSVKWIGFSRQRTVTYQTSTFLNGQGYTGIEWCQREGELLEKLTRGSKLPVLLVASKEDDLLPLCEQVTISFPHTSVVILDHTGNLDLRTAMRAGAMDVIEVSASAGQLAKELQEAEKIVEQRKRLVVVPQTTPTVHKNGKVITLCSTKGGVGKTTVAVNLAVTLANRLQRVAIVDLSLQFGDVALMFDLKPKMTIYDWVRESEEEEVRPLIEYLEPYNENIHILSVPQRPEFAEVIEGEHIRKILQGLKREYDLVLVDTPAHLDDRTLVALEVADEIFLLTYLDLPTLKNGRLFIDTLETLTLKQKVRIVLNRKQKIQGLSVETVEKVLGLPLHARIPQMEKAMIAAVNEGKPLAVSEPRAKVVKEISALADTILNREEGMKQRSKFLPKTVQIGRNA